MKVINIASDFNIYPVGRYRGDGRFSGEVFREDVLLPALKSNDRVTVILDGTMALGSSFLEEAFGGLTRLGYFSPEQLRAKFNFVSDEDESLIDEINQYIEEGVE